MKLLLHISSYPMVYIMAFLYRVSNPDSQAKFLNELKFQWWNRWAEITDQLKG